MPYNTVNLKTDLGGVVAPQYFNTSSDVYEVIEGSDGAAKTRIENGHDIVVGTKGDAEAGADLTADLTLISLMKAAVSAMRSVAGASGNIGGALGSSDNRLVRTDGTGGSSIQNTPITVTDAGAMSGVTSLTMSGALSMTGGQQVYLRETGEYVSSRSAGILDVASRGSVEVYTDTNANDAGGSRAFAVFTGASPGGGTNLFQIAKSGSVYIGDISNANMAVGLTINGGASSNEAFALKSAMSHGITGFTETDTYLTMKERSAGGGGLLMSGYATGTIGIENWAYVTTENSLKTTSASGAIIMRAFLKSGTTRADMTANANVWVLSKGPGADAVFIVDADGDYFYDGADGGAFDAFDDAHLVRSLQIHTQRGVIKSRFDDLVQYNEDALVEAGILGAPVKDGGLINGAQVQRLLLGEAWQGYVRDMEIMEALQEIAVLNPNLTLGPKSQSLLSA